jgi:hypothetical protein
MDEPPIYIKNRMPFLKVYATKGNGKEKRELDTEMIISTKKE